MSILKRTLDDRLYGANILSDGSMKNISYTDLIKEQLSLPAEETATSEGERLNGQIDMNGDVQKVEPSKTNEVRKENQDEYKSE